MFESAGNHLYQPALRPGKDPDHEVVEALLKKGRHTKTMNIRPLQGRGALQPTVPPVTPAVMHVEALQASDFLTALSLNPVVVCMS